MERQIDPSPSAMEKAPEWQEIQALVERAFMFRHIAHYDAQVGFTDETIDDIHDEVREIRAAVDMTDDTAEFDAVIDEPDLAEVRISEPRLFPLLLRAAYLRVCLAKGYTPPESEIEALIRDNATHEFKHFARLAGNPKIRCYFCVEFFEDREAGADDPAKIVFGFIPQLKSAGRFTVGLYKEVAGAPDSDLSYSDKIQQDL